MSDSISKTFSYNQSLATIILLRVIESYCIENPKRKHVIIRALVSFDLTERAYEVFREKVSQNPELLNLYFRTLDKVQKEYLILLTWELISCTGNLRDRELLLTMEVMHKAVGIEEDYFMATVDKLVNLTTAFNEELEGQFLELKKKEEPLISGQSFIFLIIISLAIIGLISLFK